MQIQTQQQQIEQLANNIEKCVVGLVQRNPTTFGCVGLSYR